MIVVGCAPAETWPPKEMTLRFARQRYAAICPNLYHRQGPDVSPDDGAASVRAAGGVPAKQFLGDAGRALGHGA